MVAQVTVHIDSVLNIVSVESDGILADRTDERILQQTDIVIVDVHIGKHVLQGNIQNVASLNELVDSR